MKNKISHIWNAEEYHDHSSIQYNSAIEILNKCKIDHYQSLLDVGCGDGKITAFLQKQLSNGFAKGIDISQQMINFARNKYPNEKYPNLEFLIMNAEDLDCSEEYDLIFSSFALQWVKKIDAFFKSAYKSLKKSGKIILTIPLGISDALENAINEIQSQKKWSSYFVNFEKKWDFRTPEKYKEALVENDFRMESTDVVSVETFFKNEDSLKKYIFQWFPYLNYLPADKQLIFFEEVMAKYFALAPPLNNGSVCFKFNRIDLIASKV